MALKASCEGRCQYRFLFYSHDGLGLGHVRRNLAIAAALNTLSPECSVLLATGRDEAAQLGLCPSVETLKLPSLQKVGNGEYVARRLALSGSEILTMRSALLEAAVETFRPDLVLIDKHPFGANGELRRTVERFRARGGLTVLGLRDILDEPAAVLAEWAREHWREEVEENFDALLIYGQRSIFDPTLEYQFSPRMVERTRFCGYVLNCYPNRWSSPPVQFSRPTERHTRPVVLATPGGGEDGFDLLRMFIQASRGGEWEGIVVSGPLGSKAQQDILQSQATEAGLAFHTFVPQLDEWFSHVDAVVCMSGYNTLAEAVSRSARVIAVPRRTPRTEQLIRARLFERLGVLQLVEPAQVTPARLAEQIRLTLRGPRERIADRAMVLDFGGAQRAAAFLLQMAAKRSLRALNEELRSEALEVTAS